VAVDPNTVCAKADCCFSIGKTSAPIKNAILITAAIMVFIHFIGYTFDDEIKVKGLPLLYTFFVPTIILR
jgi:hypothetical protein